MTTRQKLIEAVTAAMPYIPEHDVSKAVEIAFDYMGESLIHSHRIEIRGFGSFNIGERIIAPSTNLSSVIYHHKKIRTINYRMPEALRAKLNDQ